MKKKKKEKIIKILKKERYIDHLKLKYKTRTQIKWKLCRINVKNLTCN